MKKLLATTAVLVSTATVAFAGNVMPAPIEPAPVVPVVPVATTDWSGFYLGAAGGWLDGELTPPEGAAWNEFEFDGFTYGGFVGYNYQLDSGLVLGGELAFGMGEMEIGDDDGAPTFDVTTVDLKARVGFAADRALVYGFGGYTMVKADEFSANPNRDWDGDGYVFGGGVDFLVTDNIFVGAEYAYRDVEDSDNDDNPAWEGNASTISARVGFKF
ncbi:MAG: hypothetical protein CSA74_12610 [Rhodobacterales bacterium]|nr:MAG: hypothetical protein CSA74_12610 [Rhodobacterales bacterium]